MNSFYVMQDLVHLHLPYGQTDGGFFVMQVDVAPGGGPPPLHTHAAHEFFWTLSGQLTYFRDDGEDGLTEITGGPGTKAFIPGGVPHTYRNFSDEPGTYLAVLSPPQDMQDFLVEAGVQPGDALRTPEEVLAIGERSGSSSSTSFRSRAAKVIEWRSSCACCAIHGCCRGGPRGTRRRPPVHKPAGSQPADPGAGGAGGRAAVHAARAWGGADGGGARPRRGNGAQDRRNRPGSTRASCPA